MNTFFFLILLITSIQLLRILSCCAQWYLQPPLIRPLCHIVPATLYGENTNLNLTQCTRNFIDLINLRTLNSSILSLQRML
jgi:hypothetical protein